MLFDPDRHETLCASAWDAPRVQDTIRAIVRDIEHQRLPAGHWPVHPLDDEGENLRTGFKSLYLGSAGVLWALWFLQRQGAADLTIDPIAGIEQADAAYQAEPDAGQVLPAYNVGEVGILLLRWRLTGSDAVADRLYAAVRSNIGNPTNEALWGASGTMLAAWYLRQATAQQRWRDLFLDNVDQLWRTWHFDEKAQCHLWTQDMDGKVQYFGAGHGFAGNVYPLLRGAELLDAARRDELFDRCRLTLRTLAVVEGDAVNWRPGTYTPRPGSPTYLMQWCHGAPGVVTALAHYPVQHSAEMDTLLVGAGHAVWQAGPLRKGYGLCHGTAGNGCAFLQLHQRTGDAQWLGRARAFAMHALLQRDQLRQMHGQASSQGRYTLWTGDAGLAVYLWQCLAAKAGMPGLDLL